MTLYITVSIAIDYNTYLPKNDENKKNHPYIIEELKEKKYTETRIIVSNREENTQRVFITNLPYKIKSEKIENLYLKRWEIEKKHHTLKNKMKLESITGK